MYPAMMRLREQAKNYNNQNLALEQQAVRIRLKWRAEIATYMAASRRYRTATGKIAKNDAAMKRWQRLLKKKSDKLKKKQLAKERANPLKNRLSSVQTYFELDFEQETKRLLKPFQTQPQPNSR